MDNDVVLNSVCKGLANESNVEIILLAGSGSIIERLLAIAESTSMDQCASRDSQAPFEVISGMEMKWDDVIRCIDLLIDNSVPFDVSARDCDGGGTNKVYGRFKDGVYEIKHASQTDMTLCPEALLQAADAGTLDSLVDVVRERLRMPFDMKLEDCRTA